MGKCEKFYRKSDRVCIGSLNKKIKLYVRSIAQSLNNDVDYTESFDTALETWAMIETSGGKTIFDDTNIERVITHFFYIRYVPNLTQEKWIEYNGKLYDIIKVENLQEENRFYKLFVTERGSKQYPVNFA